ncbi:MAG: hypothetical protein C0490_08540, partial [Marivirga sp.]|nr:hypothetical protein [Marivirga sp.]
KRVFFTRQQINGPSAGPYDETGYEFCDGKDFIIPLNEISELSLQGNMINDRYHDPITFELVGYIAAPEECIDCRIMGGVIEKPDYWK